MTVFSASDAALEGFHLLRRRWRVVLGWAGFNLLALIMLAVLSGLLSVIAGAVSGDAAARNSSLAFMGLLAALGALFAQAIVAVGVFRLELRETEPGFLHLRIGADEVRLVLLWVIILGGASLLVGIAGALGHALGGGGFWIQLLTGALIVYLGLRFALAAPISFAERRIDFARSWRLSRGRVVALLGMTVLSLCLIGVVMLLVWVALAIVAGLTGGLEGIASLFGGAEALQRHPGIFILVFAVEIILTPVLWVLGGAPLVAAYRAFTEPEGEAA